MNISAHRFISFLFLSVLIGHSNAQQITFELKSVRDSSLPLEERVEAAKRCFNDGPLAPEVVKTLIDLMEVERPRTPDGWEEQMSPFYTRPFWGLLTDKEESMPVFVEGALDFSGSESRRLLCTVGVITLKDRGFDATEMLSAAAKRIGTPAAIAQADKLIEEISHKPAEATDRIPEYKTPPVKPSPLLKLLEERRLAREQAAKTSGTVSSSVSPQPEQLEVIPAAGKAPEGQGTPKANPRWPWIIGGLVFLVVGLIALSRALNRPKV